LTARDWLRFREIPVDDAPVDRSQRQQVGGGDAFVGLMRGRALCVPRTSSRAVKILV
jgi:hypothetical protein